jgi:hypothetical protein
MGELTMSIWFSIRSSGIVIPSEDPSWNSTIPPAMKRKDPRIWQLAYIATQRALSGSTLQCKSIISGTALGALDETKNFLDGIYGEGFGSPRNFIASVHNSMAGKLALDFKIEGPNLTVCDGHNSMASALSIASLLEDHEFPALLLLIDESISFFDTIGDHISQECKPYINKGWKDAAVALVIDKKLDSSSPMIRGFGPVRSAESSPLVQCRTLAEGAIEDFAQCEMLFAESTSSFIQPAIQLHNCYSSKGSKHLVVGSYSPVSKGTAVVEYLF